MAMYSILEVAIVSDIIRLGDCCRSPDATRECAWWTYGWRRPIKGTGMLDCRVVVSGYGYEESRHSRRDKAVEEED